jgi:hypothetical protein
VFPRSTRVLSSGCWRPARSVESGRRCAGGGNMQTDPPSKGRGSYIWGLPVQQTFLVALLGKKCPRSRRGPFCAPRTPGVRCGHILGKTFSGVEKVTVTTFSSPRLLFQPQNRAFSGPSWGAGFAGLPTRGRRPTLAPAHPGAGPPWRRPTQPDGPAHLPARSSPLARARRPPASRPERGPGRYLRRTRSSWRRSRLVGRPAPRSRAKLGGCIVAGGGGGLWST